MTNSAPQADGAAGPPQGLKAEVVVIGSGPGGAIAAALLAEAGRDVLLVEEGPFLPLDSCPPFTRLEMEQKYRNGGITVAMGRARIAYVEGRCVGGGSEINSALYHRAPAEMLQRWRRSHRVEALTEADLEPHFEACERDVNVCCLPGAPPPASLKLHQGALRLGWDSREVPRWFRYDAPVNGQPPQGTRQSMTQTFIPRALAAGGRLLSDTRVNRLRRTGGGWSLSAVHSANGNGRGSLRIRARAVFVACGSIHTPALLLRSGIRRNVGNALKLHPSVKAFARFPEVVNTPGMGVPVHQVKQFAPKYSFGCSISSRPFLALGMLDHPDRLPEVDEAWQHMAVYYAMSCTGSGTVRPVPMYRDPLVRYELSDADLCTLSDALGRLGRALLAAGADVVYPSVHGLGPFRTEADLAAIPRPLPPGQANLMTIHIMSGCPMGEDTARCATDSWGKVHGADDLYVADASLLCDAPGVNPQGMVMALVRRNTMKFLGEL